MINRNQLTSLFRFAFSSKMIVASFAILLLGLFTGWNVFLSQPHHAEAASIRDNDDNAIIKNGALTTSEFATKYKEDKPGDLHAIYAEFGLSASQISRFQKTAKAGTVYKDGRIEVDGKVVATNAKSLGRQNIPGSTKKTIDGKTYYQRDTSVSFIPDSLPALVMFNDDDVAEFVVITACGNPVTFTPKKPPAPQTAQCKALNRRQIDRDTFGFTTTAPVDGGAKVTKLVYDFGDTVTKSEDNSDTEVQHTYKPGKYTAVVTVTFTVNGKTKTAECSKPIEVKEETPPPQPTPPTPPVTPPTTPQTPPAPAPSLPTTGPVEIIGGAAGLSSLAGAGYYWRDSRRGLINRLLRRK